MKRPARSAPRSASCGVHAALLRFQEVECGRDPVVGRLQDLRLRAVQQAEPRRAALATHLEDLHCRAFRSAPLPLEPAAILWRLGRRRKERVCRAAAGVG